MDGQAVATLNYSGTIKRLLMVTGPNPTPDQVASYYGQRRRDGMSYSYATYMSVGLERFMEMMGTPVHLGRAPKPQRVLKHVLSESEVTLFIAAATTVRVRALLSVLAFSGVRNEELCKLKIDDVNIGENVLHVSGKGAKDRKACITGTCTEALIDHLQERKKAGALPEDRLFVTARNGNDMEPQDIRKIVRHYGKKAGLKRRIHPHLLRHSLATNLVKRGASILAVRDQLGHEFLSSTLLYVHTTVEDLKNDYRRFAPCYM